MLCAFKTVTMNQLTSISISWGVDEDEDPSLGEHWPLTSI